MSTPQRAPRSRSAFAAAFLSLLFPGLGHAYAGAYSRALAFAAAPLLLLALLGGIVLRADRADLLGFAVQQPVLIGLFVVNGVALLYRIVAAVDAWQVARFLNAVDASGGGRLGRARLPLSPLSIAGLLAVLLVMAGGHVAVARYNAIALNVVDCVFIDGEDPSCDLPGDSPDPGASDDANVDPSASPDAVPTPGAGTPAPTLPPWDGKERLNVLLVGSDQRKGDATFNTDTMIVASIDPGTGQVALFQVPRDTVGVPIPASARGAYGSSVYTNKINSWFRQNRNRTDLWPGKTAQARGFAALKAILGELYGLDIQYYVMVNFQGFTRVVDTLGGLQVNVQIPVSESTYPYGGGKNVRIYIPAGPQHMTGAQALIYARSRHGSNDFDRGLRQQRVLVSVRDQMSAQAILANLQSLVDALKGSIKTDIKTADLPKLLALADSVDTKNIRSFNFAPPYFATDMWGPSNGTNSDLVINVARVRKAARNAFTITPQLLALQQRLAGEAARVWVFNGSGRTGLASEAADYLAYNGLEASAPNQKTATIPATTVVVYNGAEATMPHTIAYLEDILGVKVTTATDPKVTVDMIVTLGKSAPTLKAPVVG
jgi:polyisoprenyl-teichoic acid--peptidoglycan teichoic acid transferase